MPFFYCSRYLYFCNRLRLYRFSQAFFLLFFLIICSLSACIEPISTSHIAVGMHTKIGQVALTNLHWCNRPALSFRDQASPMAPGGLSVIAGTFKLGPANGTPVALTNWMLVKANLAFTVFLPTTLPVGTCLLSAASSLRDPVFGSNFTISYILPGHNVLTFSQAPLLTQSSPFQCSSSRDKLVYVGAQVPSTLFRMCSGVRARTSIVFSARGTASMLKQIFQQLQPNVNWLPA